MTPFKAPPPTPRIKAKLRHDCECGHIYYRDAKIKTAPCPRCGSIHLQPKTHIDGRVDRHIYGDDW